MQTAAEPTRQQLAQRYLQVRAFSEQLCEPLAIEDYGLQTAVEASPPKWHIAHVSWFFENFLLRPLLPGYQVFHSRFDHLFNSYYEQTESGFWPRAKRGLLSRPTVAEVYDYRKHVDHGMQRLIQECDGEDWRLAQERILIGLNHEQQHQELLLTDIKHHLAFNPLRPAYRSDLDTSAPEQAVPLTFTAIEGGMTELGATGAGFAYDNEHPRHPTWLAPYRLADRLVTNGEYLEFIADGAYANPAIWLSDAWAVIRQQGWQAPLYWEQIDGSWHEMTLAGLIPLQPALPVCHLSYFEAEAYARWAGKRLPSEAEWEHAAAQRPIEGLFVDSGRLHPRAASVGELSQLYGDCWEWTGSAYLPYPGYRPAAGAIGEYNGKFMCNQMVLRGGSCATSRDHLRPSYRNFCYPHERWQFSGLRLADAIDGGAA
ncbi:ergothioneine biosynthesis protein EgtB [Thiorhodovibrio frisius]|uniref:TIGR03440 family protein n=1 Tax=Thiorhodovibrio frisius TaxID=631362 RepID=H8YX76_9GAMM|nr:ergothioneine biosynthesis protein EgtB [Thiorhodovibrio frisius]EIC23052.1 TIGR03440 family protein [Thiorhodovibrio frisius]WPL22683.1 Iron(II)-dependent oxidoreductase EgtB [Thiorhodovibrio frisius]